MILNTPMTKKDLFLRDVSQRLDPGGDGRFTIDSTDAEGHEFVYLGTGYWRGIYCPSYKAEPIAGSAPSISLINPDRTGVEIMHVEAGLAVLLRCAFDETRVGMATAPGCRHRPSGYYEPCRVP